jgi:hypothetical protein
VATTTTPPTTAPPADRGAPVAFLAQPKTLVERLQYLRRDAARILRAPDRHRADEVRWAHDMLDSDLHTGKAAGYER